MHSLPLKIKLKPGDHELLDKRFRIMARIHNVMVKHAEKLLRILRRDKEYGRLLDEYLSCKDDETHKKEISGQLNVIRGSYGLSEKGLQAYAKIQANKHKSHLSSQQVQKEASRVYKGVEDVLFGHGDDVHFKKETELLTISGKSPANGIKLYDRFHDFLPRGFERDGLTDGVLWNGHWFCIDVDYKDRYVLESLNNEVSYCEVMRKAFNDGWHYYINVILKGEAPQKLVPGGSRMGIDPGTSTFAGVSETAAMLRELAPGVSGYEKEIYGIQQHIDRSKRRSNPENYNPDGTIKKGRHKWTLSKSCRQALWDLRTLHRKKAAYVKQSHEELADEAVADSSVFIVEAMDYRALAKRSKKATEKSGKTITVKKKDGTEKTVHKNKRKKRFGHSIGARAPSSLLTILQRKCKQYGLLYYETDTRKFKASQYDHVKDEFIPCTLKDRTKIIGRTTVQRDLYSAFLNSCSNDMFDHADRELCTEHFPHFVELMEKEITRMKEAGISKKECFGF